MELTKAFYSPMEIAEMLDMKSSDTIMRWIHEGKLFAIQLSTRTYRVPQRAVARLIGIPVVESHMTEDVHGGEVVAAQIRKRVREEESVAVKR